MAKQEKAQRGLTSEHTTTVDAVHPSLGKRTFTLYEWNMMPEGKYGYSKAAEVPASVSKKQTNELQKAVETAQTKVEKATKKRDDLTAKYMEITALEDAEKKKQLEPQAKMKLDDAAREFTSASDELAKAQEALTAAGV